MGHFEFCASALMQQKSTFGRVITLPDKEFQGVPSLFSPSRLAESSSSRFTPIKLDPIQLQPQHHQSTSGHPVSNNSMLLSKKSKKPISGTLELIKPSLKQLDTPLLLNSEPHEAGRGPRADQILLNTVITSASSAHFSKLTLTEIKKVDRHGCIYEAKQIAGEDLFEVRVYSFGQKDPIEKQYVKRNCREWKKRRRFLDSHQENGFIFLILKHPKSKTVDFLSSTMGGENHLSTPGSVGIKTANQIDTLVVKEQHRDPPKISPLDPTPGFTMNNIAQMSSALQKNMWAWKSEWDWSYPQGWFRNLIIYDKGIPRDAICWSDFDGGFFNGTVPRRIFSSEQLVHPDERKPSKNTNTVLTSQRTANTSPVTVSRFKIQVLLGVWFSADNLCDDIPLRRYMDSRGFVCLSVIASHEEQNLDMNVLRSVCIENDNIIYAETLNGVGQIRCKQGWERWVLPLEERDPSARGKF